METDQTPLGHIVPPGEYSIQWQLPDENGGTKPVEGMIELISLRPPRGSLFDGAPIEWESDDSDASRSASFPQTNTYPVLRGRLRSNYSVYLIDAEVVTWFDDRAAVHARCALVGWPPASDNIDGFRSLRVQTTFLDRLAGVAPFSKFKVPVRAEGQPIEWSAQQSEDLNQNWTSDSGELRLGWDCRARTGDPYEMLVRYSPVVTIDFAGPLSLDQIIGAWIQPLRGISTIAMGHPTEVTFVSLATDPAVPDDNHGQQFMQLYGSGLSQDPYAASRYSPNDRRPALTFKTDGLSLLTLLEGWAAHAKGRHPLYETYVSVLGVPNDHPRNRFLLLVQALEGHYGHTNKSKLAESKAKHEARRSEYLAMLEESDLDKLAKKWLTKYVAKSPRRGLDEALTWANKTLPTDMSGRLKAADLIKTVISDVETVNTWQNAVRVIRNDLAHGNRTYDSSALRKVTEILDLMVRAHVLRTLDAGDKTLANLLEAEQ